MGDDLDDRLAGSGEEERDEDTTRTSAILVAPTRTDVAGGGHRWWGSHPVE